MIPSTNTVLTTDLEFEQMPSKQHKMDLEKFIIRDFVDDQDAVRQSIYKILNTERYSYVIYSWNYGIELKDLFGMSPLKVCPKLKKRITEALLQDDRITKVDSFEFDTSKKGVVSCTFTAHTIFGDLKEGVTVDV